MIQISRRSLLALAGCASSPSASSSQARPITNPDGSPRLWAADSLGSRMFDRQTADVMLSGRASPRANPLPKPGDSAIATVPVSE